MDWCVLCTRRHDVTMYVSPFVYVTQGTMAKKIYTFL